MEWRWFCWQHICSDIAGLRICRLCLCTFHFKSSLRWRKWTHLQKLKSLRNCNHQQKLEMIKTFLFISVCFGKEIKQKIITICMLLLCFKYFRSQISWYLSSEVCLFCRWLLTVCNLSMNKHYVINIQVKVNVHMKYHRIFGKQK